MHKQTDLSDLLSGLPFWQYLDPDEKTAVKRYASLRHYKKGSHIFGNMDSCLGLVYLVSGQARVYILSDGGREITLFRVNPKESCVLTASCVISQITFDTEMIVSQDAEILIIPSSLLATLSAANIYVRCLMYEMATERFSTVMWVMQQILFSKFDKRLASFLIGIYEENGSPEVHMTQEAIALEINSAREVVARMLKQFAADGLIQNKRGTIRLKDIAGLKEIIAG